MQIDPQQGARLKLALIGFGEAGQAFAAGWQDTSPAPTVVAYDIKTQVAETAEEKWKDYQALKVAGAETLAEAVDAAAASFSLVTADQAEAAAEQAAQVLTPGSWFFDCNSCSPGAKRRSAEVLAARGIRYIDTAVMAPVHPARHRTPLLLSGPAADEAEVFLQALEMKAKIAGPEVGIASATKMLRSVMVKGIEALTLECLLAARSAGVDAAVLASLDASMPGWNWPRRAAYNMERTTTHGLRRAAEMREVVRTVEELGLPSNMSRAIVEWQQRAGELELRLNEGSEDYAGRADRIKNAIAGAPRAAE